jgi:hypothetical protein
MNMSEWRAERNRKALARLERALPEIFPAPVLARAAPAVHAADAEACG